MGIEALMGGQGNSLNASSSAAATVTAENAVTTGGITFGAPAPSSSAPIMVGIVAVAAVALLLLRGKRWH